MINRKSPWSYRPGTPRDDRILAYAALKGIEKSEAMHRLIDIGLAQEGVPQDVPEYERLTRPAPKASPKPKVKAPPPEPASAPSGRWRV